MNGIFLMLMLIFILNEVYHKFCVEEDSSKIYPVHKPLRIEDHRHFLLRKYGRMPYQCKNVSKIFTIWPSSIPTKCLMSQFPFPGASSIAMAVS